MPDGQRGKWGRRWEKAVRPTGAPARLAARPVSGWAHVAGLRGELAAWVRCTSGGGNVVWHTILRAADDNSVEHRHGADA